MDISVGCKDNDLKIWSKGDKTSGTQWLLDKRGKIQKDVNDDKKVSGLNNCEDGGGFHQEMKERKRRLAVSRRRGRNEAFGFNLFYFIGVMKMQMQRFPLWY